MASSKLGLDYGLKSAEASKNTAEAGKTNLMVQAALSHIAAGGSLDDLGAILSGHSVPQRFSTEPSVTGDPNAARVVTNMRTGQVFQKLPLPANIEQHIAADMKTTGKSRTDVLRAYQEKGYDVSGIK